MNKEQTKTLVELWNEVGEPPCTHDNESPYYLHRSRLECCLQDILEREFSTVIDQITEEVNLVEYPLQGSEEPDFPWNTGIYSWITLSDFRSNFNWEEEYCVVIRYPYLFRKWETDSYECTSKEEVRRLMSGGNTDFERYEPCDGFVDGGDFDEFDSENIDHCYHIRIKNLRVKGSVVEETNVSGM